MEWFQTLTIIITILGINGYMLTRFDNAMSKQTERSDRLYEMFIDLLKQGGK